MSGLPGYFIGPDANDETWLWRENGANPVPVLERHRFVLDDPELWNAIAVLVERGAT